MWEANSKGKNIVLAWIPGHSGIEGNETASQLPKLEPRILKFPKRICRNLGRKKTKKLLPQKDPKQIPKQNMVSVSRVLKQETSDNNKSDKNNMNVNKSLCYTILPLQISTDSPLCKCGNPGTLKHILVECRINVSQQQTFIKN